MIPDYIVVILGWVLLISITIILIADIIVMCVVNKKLKVFNKVYEELLKDKENEKMSKGLEALKDIVEIAIAHCCAEEAHQVAFKSETIEKELKALEILKIRFSGLDFDKDLIGYYFQIGNSNFYLTKEEYDLLKEILL